VRDRKLQSALMATVVDAAGDGSGEGGLFQISRKLYGENGPAFYGLRTTLLTLVLMARRCNSQ
jgi:hypothetical protein